MSLGDSEEDQVSGSVSATEIAAALQQSTPSLPGSNPPSKKPPKGMPPLGLVPEGLPPPIPVPSSPQVAPPAEAFVPNNGPPLPPTGLPSGWTMEQWKHYGQAWLDKQKK